MTMNNESEIKKNKELLEKHPWLWPQNWWGEPLPSDRFDYSSTLLDEIPTGWKINFGDQMCNDIQDVLDKRGCANQFHIIQIKEKFGSLRIYVDPLPGDCLKEIREVITQYEIKSAETCCECGKPAEYMSTGWICPYCKECATKISGGELNDDKFKAINRAGEELSGDA